MFLSNKEANLIILLEGLFAQPSASYEVWNTETGECRSPRVELPKLSWIYCASVAGRRSGGEFKDLLLVGGSEGLARGRSVVEYSIVGAQLEIGRTCRLFSLPKSVCTADLRDETGQSSVTVGGFRRQSSLGWRRFVRHRYTLGTARTRLACRMRKTLQFFAIIGPYCCLRYAGCWLRSRRAR